MADLIEFLRARLVKFWCDVLNGWRVMYADIMDGIDNAFRD